MHILHIVTDGGVGGAQRHVLDIIEGMPEVDHSLAAGNDGWLTEMVAQQGKSVEIIGSLRRDIAPRDDLASFRSIRRLYRRITPDIAHLHSSKAGIIGRWAALGYPISTVFTAHGWAFAEGVPPARRFYGVAAEGATARLAKTDHIVTVSEADRDLALRHRIAPPRRITTVHNGIASIDPPDRPGHQTFTVVMVARFADQKDQATLIRAAAQLDAPIRLVFCGAGDGMAAAETLATGLSVDATFLGEVPDSLPYLAKADAFALTSHWEGFPISVLEAMRASLPVVATDVGGVREAVVDGETGFLVPRSDPEALAERLSRLSEDAIVRRGMGTAGRSRFEALFTRDVMVDKLRRIYDTIADGHS